MRRYARFVGVFEIGMIKKKYETAELKLKTRKWMMNSKEMRKSRLSIGITAVVQFVFLSAQTSYATTTDRSTFQQWTFNSLPGQPDANGFYGPFSPYAGNLDNDFGAPLLYVGDRAKFLEGAINVWELRNDNMDIYIPNSEGGDYKDISVTLTWAKGTAVIVPDLPKEPIVWTSPQGFPTGIINNPPIFGTSTTFTFRIEPNPSEEWLFINGNISLFSVSVSTVCMPEPATLGLFIGGAFLAFKRRRNKYGNKQIAETVGDTNL
jgi:hypothetical protein